MEQNKTEMTLEAALAAASNPAPTEEVPAMHNGETIDLIGRGMIEPIIMAADDKKEDNIVYEDESPSDRTNPQESIANLENFSSKMDDEVAEARKIYEANKAKEAMLNNLANKKVNISDFKDNIIDMDDAEEEAIVEEVEVVKQPARDLTAVTIKKSKKLSEEDIMKRFVKKIEEKNVSSRVVMVNSGYAASMSGFSSPALRNVSAELAQYDKDFGATDYRYRLVHSKIKDTTIGEMDYMTFLKQTSLLEIDIAFYGIVCSTYPDKNQFPGKCPKCDAKFKYDYYNSDYLKVSKENMDDVTTKVAALLKGQAINPEEIFENAPTNMVTREILEDSGIIVELRHPTLYDHLYDVLQTLGDRSSSLVNSMPFIESVLIPDGEGYFKIESVENKLNVLEQLSEADDIKLAENIKEIIDQSKIEFAMQNISCPYCKHSFPDQSVSMEQMLFTIHQIKITNK